MSVKEGKAELIWGIVFMALGLLLAFVLIPTQIKSVDTKWFNSPRLFPYVIAGFLFVLGGVLSVTGHFKDRRWQALVSQGAADEQEVYSISSNELKAVLATLATIALYVGAMSFLPYIPCTILALGFLMWLYGLRSWVKLVSISVLFPLAIYFAFTVLLKLKMP